MTRSRQEELLGSVKLISCLMCFHWGYLVLGWTLLAFTIFDFTTAVVFAWREIQSS